MPTITADRFIAWNADRSRLVEGDDPESAFAAFNEGCEYDDQELAAAGAKWNGKKIVILGKSDKKSEDKNEPSKEDKKSEDKKEPEKTA